MRGTFTGFFSMWLGLIALQAVVSSGGSGRVAQAFADVDTVVKRLLDPSVPGIPDLRGGS